MEMLKGIEIDESLGLDQIDEQIRDFLSKRPANFTNEIVKLFDEWDDDDSGKIEKKEFRKGMKMLGLTASKKQLEDLFDSWDGDKTGSITIEELKVMLSRPPVKKLGTNDDRGTRFSMVCEGQKTSAALEAEAEAARMYEQRKTYQNAEVFASKRAQIGEQCVLDYHEKHMLARLSNVSRPGGGVFEERGRMAQAREEDAIEQIMNLKKLHDVGAISLEEFEAKKAELLSRI